MDILKGTESYAPKTSKNLNPQNFDPSMANRSLLFKLSTFSNENHIENAKVDIEEELTDPKFADLIAGRFGSISTDKQINWDSRGSRTLTDVQKRLLMEEYNVENISKQDFYNLFSDLTNMDIISRDDIRRMFFSNVVTNATLIADDEYDSLDGFNPINETQRSVGELIAGLEYYKSKDFWKYNPNMQNHEYTIIVQKIEDRKESFTKFWGILTDLKKDFNVIRKAKTPENADFEQTEEFTPNQLNENNVALNALGPNAPLEVRVAWDKAEQQVGVSGYGAESFGNLTYVNAMVNLKVQDSVSSQKNDFLGTTVATAINATKKALFLVENSNISSSQNPEDYKQERAFYTALLQNLS